MSPRQKLLLLTSLYIAQGLPYGFFTQALPVLMREQGASLKAISATSLLFLPWALKFLWAPMVDRYGTRRQWILPLQLATAAGAGLLALGDYSDGLRWVFIALFLFNIGAAMQDVATDGWAVRLLDSDERGTGNAIQVGAYRIGMILGGGALLWVFAQSGWAVMFMGMSLLLALCCLPVLAAPDVCGATTPIVRAPLRRVIAGWWPRLKRPGMGAFIGLICFYKFGDSMAASLIGPFMKDAGLATETIALVKGTLGSASTLLGAWLGGLLARRSRRRALWVSGVLTTASLALYLIADLRGGDVYWIAAACVAEHVFGGMAVVALFTLMMDASDPDHASTDYTLLACALVIAHGAAVFAGAALADAAGFAVLFSAGLLLSGAGCLVLVRGLDRGAGPALLRSVWVR